MKTRSVFPGCGPESRPRTCAFSRRRLLAFALGLPAATRLQGAPEQYSQKLWSLAEGIYCKILEHPFLTGLMDGSLPPAKFRYYLVQDSLYLGRFAQTLHLMAGRAPRQEWALTLSRHAREAVESEQRLHGEVLSSYGVRPEEVQQANLAPVNLAYTNHLLATASLLSFLEAVTAVLPCYWIYWEVGRRLEQQGSRRAEYQLWIRQYASEEFGKSVREVIAIADGASRDAARPQLESGKQLFVLSARYEYLFWDMAWREEQWQP